MTTSIAELVARTPLFEGMTQERIELLAGCGGNVHFKEGATLFREGERADVFYLLRQGSIALETFVPGRGPIEIETLDEGDVLGWSWLFPPYRWAFDARAVTRVRAIGFDTTCLRTKLETDPALGYDLMSRFAQVLMMRLKWTRIRLLDVYGDVHAR
jgi:CRP/FNR family transcriptional regulator, cyclic AMP receptor protein